MSSYMPFMALMSVSKSRRKRLLPLALPAVAGIPAAQAGALAVISADSVARREGNVATAEATTAVTDVLTTAVAHGAELTLDDLKHIPLAEKVVTARPDILTPASFENASSADLRRAAAIIQSALEAQGGQSAATGSSAAGSGSAAAKGSSGARSSGGSGGSSGGGEATTDDSGTKTGR